MMPEPRRPVAGSSEGGEIGRMLPVAAYVRMSTEHQRYSINNQLDAIHRYANENGMAIVKTYADSGKSGLSLEKRDGLQRLLADVEACTELFSAIVVFDISRWGRFQDADEGAFYEFWCRRAGYAVHYCAEQFENDGSPLSSVIKSIKRAMAAEYSRELSRKVLAGQERIIRRGFKMGGTPGYGLRRFLVDGEGNPKGPLPKGSRKNLQSDRVIFVPGPKEEIEIINQVYRWFVEDRLGLIEIAARLNEREVKCHFRNGWTMQAIRDLLTNEKYIGNLVFNRTSNKLGGGVVRNHRDKWLVVESAFEPIVDPDLFDAAQQEYRRRFPRYTEEELLNKLKQLLGEHGFLSRSLIDASPNIPYSETYRKRFGDMTNVYARIGYYGAKQVENLLKLRNTASARLQLTNEISEFLKEIGAVRKKFKSKDVFSIAGELEIGTDVAMRCRKANCPPFWFIRRDAPCDVTICARLDISNQRLQDCFLLPSIIFHERVFRTGHRNAFELERFRISWPDDLQKIARRQNLIGVAVGPVQNGCLAALKDSWIAIEGDDSSGPLLPKANNYRSKKLMPIVRRYQTAVLRERKLLRNCRLTSARLDLVVAATRQLLSDDHFRTLLRAEGISSVPKVLADRLADAEDAK